MTTLLELRWRGHMLFAMALAKGETWYLFVWLGAKEFTFPPLKWIDNLAR